MKKLLTLVAVALVAVGVHAAATSWDFALNGLYGMDDTGSSGFDGFISGATVQLIANGSPVGDIMTTDVDGNAIGSIAGDTSGTGIYAADTPWDMIVSLDIGDTNYKQTFSFNIPSGLNGDLQNDSGIFTDLNSQLYGLVMPNFILMTSEMANEGWTATPVPEPTSVALLALGLAALGLKRKVA